MPDLKELRTKVGLTQSELADKSGLRQATISALENGRTRPHPGTLQVLANALETDTTTLRAALPPAVAQTPTAMNSSEAEQYPPKPIPIGTITTTVLSVSDDRPPTKGLRPPKKVVPLNREAFDPEDLGELEWNWKNANRAMEKHAHQWKEAMSFLDPILKKHPEFLEARKLMRSAEIEAGLKIPLSDRIPPPQTYIGRAQKKLESGHALEAIEILEEKVFVYLPINSKANLVLHQAALAAGLPDTARFALEFAAAKNPDDKEIYQKLADYYTGAQELESACLALKHVTAIDPSDLKAAKAYKDMVATASMAGGKIDEKSHDERIRLERRERQALTDEQKRAEIDELVQAYSDGKDDEALAPAAREGLRRAAKFARELGENQLADLELALDLQHQLVEAFPNDPVLVSEIDELSVAVSERRLLEAERDSSEGAELDTLRAEASQMRLDAAERAAHANPTNGEAQLSLGRAFIGAERFREAVKPLQKAKKDPRSGNDIEAMSLLADCFMRGGLTELAQTELESALEKIDEHGGKEADRQWKDLNYKLALLCEQAELDAEAKRLFAKIYAKDSDYRDVEKRVWGG